MPFIARDQIDPALRAKYEGQHKAQLKAALLQPGLTELQRTHLRAEIRNLGQPKTYSADAPAKLGAISFTEET